MYVPPKTILCAPLWERQINYKVIISYCFSPWVISGKLHEDRISSILYLQSLPRA